nr:hypothetical protein Itr_chr14CG25000 [Ipomoea trifida]
MNLIFQTSFFQNQLHQTPIAIFHVHHVNKAVSNQMPDREYYNLKEWNTHFAVNGCRTLNGSISIECILYELEVVQKTKVDVFKHKSLIKYLFDAYGRSSSPKECRRVFSKERHWLLKHTKEDVSANDSGETSEITGCEKTLVNSSDPISS